MRFVITSLLAAPALMPPLYAQQNLTWDANNAGSGTGGSGTWDTSSPNWLNGASFQAWQNPTFDNAILGGTAGNITLSMPIAAHNITFRTDGYTISGSTLTLGGGTRPTIFVHAPVAIINSTLAGTGGFIKNASGTLILTADNTGFSGVATVILGTLRVDNANALGVSTAASDLVLSKGTTFHFNSDFVHDYTLIGDTVNVQGGEGKTWDGSPILTASATLNLNGIGGTLAGDLADTGGNLLSLTRNGAGRMALSGNNTYTGVTTVTQGVLQLGSAGALSAGSNLVFNGAVGAGGSIELTGASGDFTRSLGMGAGQVRWTGDGGFQSSGSDRVVDIGGGSGTLTWGSGGFVPTGNRLILGTSNNGMLDFQNGIDLGGMHRTIQVEGGTSNGHARMNGVLSGTGGLNVVGMGPALLELTAVNTYSGGTVLTSGTLSVSSDANLGAASGAVTFNGGTLANTAAFSTGRSVTLNTAGDTFQTDSDLIVNETISGGGTLNKTGAAALILTGTNTYTGGTTINAGTLQIGDGRMLGSIAGNVTNNGVLTFNRSGNISYGGVISGTGDLNKQGAGLLTLTGDSGGFGGHTFVNDGTLAIKGALGGTLDVLAGGRLQGDGDIGAAGGMETTVVAGTIAPGNSIGTLTVNGNYVQLAGSTYEVEIAPAGVSDRIVVSGLADIQGGRVSVIAAGGAYAPGSRYTILTANDGLTGRFDTLAQGLPRINLGLAYDLNNVYLDILRFCDIAGTRNQCAGGSGAESLGPGNPIYSAIVDLPDQESARRAFNTLSGEGHASVKGVMIEDSRFMREAVSDRMRQAFSATGAQASGLAGQATQHSPATGRTFWSRAFGSFGHRDGDGNATRIGRNIGGVFLGGDVLIADKFLLGVATGYSHSFYNVNQLSTSSSDNYHISLYGATQWGPLGLRLGSAYVWHDLETNRNIAFAGFSDHAKGNYTAHTAQVFGEVGYGLPFDMVLLEPFARIAYVNLDANSFQERGGPAALRSPKDNQGTAYTTVGLNAAKTFSSADRMTTTLRGTLGWRHAFGDRTPLSTFAFAGGSSFATAGVPIAGDAIVISGGLDVNIIKAATLGIYYNGQVLHNIVDNGVRANLSWKF
ncbi:autotransporter outer membrane beta-barrel domain-containing protein [Nitrosospira briensis]|uniref:autotransporter outer membrane beta-barrel domain-containing protein n=1 Tax=Nitrosospira briensis TaxID=35799 RepID=UPI0008E67149|nr:autotransporter domain-containing protein [Nitrosospira briensis]SFN74018.1 outer membrane autotransporter barrel domain-containing protein [Nitrosospira briensis]